MVKNKKKRNKVYRGKDAAQRRPDIIRVEAVQRNKPQLWWHENKRVAKPIFLTVLVVAIIIVLIYELFRAINMG
jgi:hypothetical protein